MHSIYNTIGVCLEQVKYTFFYKQHFYKRRPVEIDKKLSKC